MSGYLLFRRHKRGVGVPGSGRKFLPKVRSGPSPPFEDDLLQEVEEMME